MQFTAPADFKRVLIGAFGKSNGNIGFHFRQQALANDGRGDFLAFRAGKRAVIDGDGDRHGGRVNRCRGQRLINGRIANRIGNRGFGETGNANEVSGRNLIDRHAFRAFKAQQLGQPTGFNMGAVQINRLDRGIDLGRALQNAAGQAAPNIGVAIQ